MHRYQWQQKRPQPAAATLNTKPPVVPVRIHDALPRRADEGREGRHRIQRNAQLILAVARSCQTVARDADLQSELEGARSSRYVADLFKNLSFSLALALGAAAGRMPTQIKWASICCNNCERAMQMALSSGEFFSKRHQSTLSALGIT